jgi:hypothetical protein
MYPVTCIHFAAPYNRHRLCGLPFSCCPQRSKVAFSNWIHPLSGRPLRSGWKHAKVDEQLDDTPFFVNRNGGAKRPGAAVRISNVSYPRRTGENCYASITIRDALADYSHLIILKFYLTLYRMFQKSFTILNAHINLFRGHAKCFELSYCSKTHRVLARIVAVQCDFHC